MIKIKMIIILLLLFLPALTRADDENRKLERSEESPLGNIIIEHYENSAANDYHFREIWLVSKEDPQNRFLLYSHGRSAAVIFSPNESWLVINDYLGSNASDVLLFRKKGGLKYSEVKKADVFGKA